MLRPRRSALAALACLVFGASLTVAGPATAKAFDIVVEPHYVETRHGEIYVEVARPVDGDKAIKGPAIFTYSPYSAIYAGDRTGGWDEYVTRGYVRVFADVVGTGNSGGCYDYGGKREKETAYDLVEWIAKQDWSTGKVAMIGGSYEGTTANAAAVMRPPHLTTIVPEAAISRWYGYAYSGGIRYSLNNEALSHQGPGAAADEGIDTPLAFDFGFAIPPPADPTGPGWAERVQSTVTPCEEVQHTQHGYDDTPDYDEFWLERDYVKDAHKITIPVLVSHNWGDWNVKQEEGWNFFHALKNSSKRVMYFGTRWEGHGTPSDAEYGQTISAWFDHYLMGIDNGIEKLPSIISQTSDYDGAGKWFRGKPKVTNIALVAQESVVTSTTDYKWKLLPSKPNLNALTVFGGQPTVAKFPSAGINTESHALHHGRSNHDWFWFESPPLKRDMRIFGSPKVQVWSHVWRKWVTVTPSIADVDPEGHQTVGNQHVANCPPTEGAKCGQALVAVTRGWLDSRYRNGLAKQVELTPGKPFGLTIVAKPQDYTFKAGHVVGLNIQTEINEWSLPKQYPGCDRAPEPPPPAGSSTAEDCTNFYIDWKEAKTRLILPVVDAPRDLMDLFDLGGHDHGSR